MSAFKLADLPVTSIPDLPIHEMTRATKLGERRWRERGLRFIRSYHDARKLLALVQPNAVVCVASSIAVPLFLAARGSGATTVFVESITRVTRPSLTAQLLASLRLCNRIYVQWPESQAFCPNAVYSGHLS